MTHFATVSSLELFKLWSLLVISFNVFSTPAASREDSWRAYGQSKKNGSLPPRMSVPHPAQFNTDPGADMGSKVPGIVEQWSQKPSVELGLATPEDCLTRDAEPAEEVAWPGGGHTGEGCLPLWFYRRRQHPVGSRVGGRQCTVPYNRPRSVVAQRPELIMYPTWVTVIQNQCVITILGGFNFMACCERKTALASGNDLLIRPHSQNQGLALRPRAWLPGAITRAF